jgi:hypothetical protein
MFGASGDGEVEAIESFPAFSKVPRSSRAQGGIDFGEKLLVIGIVLPEYANVSFSA